MTLRLVVALALLVPACERDEIEVRKPDPARADDYGRAAIASAVAELEANATSPAAYRAFADKVESLRHRFTEAMIERAERELVFRALPPMDAVFERSIAEQQQALALTVWPAAFEQPTREGETVRGYLDRICLEGLALECQYVVPSQRPLVLGRYAWKRMKERARIALAKCVTCPEPHWAEAVATFEERDDVLFTQLSQLGDDGDRSAWARGGEHARPWSGSPLFKLRHGEAHMNGEPVPGGGWRDAMAAARSDSDVLGVYLGSTEEIRLLKAVAEDAAAAGYTEIALQVRDPSYPYAAEEYRLRIGRRARGERVRVRDEETIQVLVQALDATIAARGGPVRL